MNQTGPSWQIFSHTSHLLRYLYINVYTFLQTVTVFGVKHVDVLFKKNLKVSLTIS